MKRPKKQKPSKKDPSGVDKSFKSTIKNAVWVYKLLFKFSKRDTIIYLLTQVYSVAIPTATAYYSAKIIDIVIDIVGNKVPLESALSISSPLITTLLLVVSLSFSTNFANKINRYVFTRIRRFHIRSFEIDLLYKMSQLDIPQFEDPEISNNMNRAKENVYKIEVFFQRSVLTLGDLIATAISGVIALRISPILFCFIALISIPNNLIFAKFIREVWDFFNSFTEKRRSWGRLTWGLGYERYLPEYKITKSNTYLTKIARGIQQNLWQKEWDIYKNRLRSEFLTNLLNATVYILTPIILLGKAIQGSITIGEFTFYQGKILDFSRDLDYIFGSFLELSDSASYVSFLRKIMELKPEIVSGTKKLPSDKPPKIEFKNVSFKYPKAKEYALRNISFTIKPGEEIAIVGENGAGKTTLIRLLVRFYDVTEGKILINDTPIKELSLNQYHNLIGALFQDYNSYGSLSILDNIGIGDVSQKFSKRKVVEAAKNADAHNFIKRLDKKYKQLPSKDFTGGTNLSTGQWQKIALARMFYRNRPILILDEPTASIDAEAEYKIFKRVYSFIKNKTVIIISHRFSTVRNAQKIYVLKQGKLIESGTHEQLLKKKGVYAKAFKLQAEGYTK